MKTPIKWNIHTVLIMLIISILSIMLTGHSMDGKEEMSQLGNTVLARQKAVTYLEDANISIESPKQWNRVFRDTKKGFGKYLKDNNFSFIMISEEWNYYVEVAVHDANDMTLHNIADSYYTTSSEIIEETIELEEVTFTKYTYERHATTDKEYNVITQYVTTIDEQCIELNCYYSTEEKVTMNDELETLDSKMFPIIKSITLGDATKNIKKNDDTTLTAIKGFTFSIWILILPLFYILFCGMRVKDADYIPNIKERRLMDQGLLSEDEIYGAWQKDPLGLAQSKSLLGFFAVLIVMHHLVQTIGSDNAGIFAVLEDFGVCLVGGFFFFSGYGLIRSIREKSDYLKGFLKKRFPTILIPFYICTFVFILVDLLQGKRYDFGKLLSYASGWILLNTHMWYIVEIAILYIAFFLIFRFVKKHSLALFFMLGFLVLLTIGSLLLCHGQYWFQGEWWYNSTLIFFLGLLLGEYEGKILTFFKNHFVGCTLFALCGFVLFQRLTGYMLMHYGYWTEDTFSKGYADKFMTLGPQLLMTFFFVILLIVISLKCRFDNPALRFLGKISLELYLIHNLFIMKMDFISGTGLYVLAVLLCSILAATLLHTLDTFLLCKILKKALPPKKKIFPVIKSYFADRKKVLSQSIFFAQRHPKLVATLLLRHIACLLLCIISVAPLYILFINATRTSHSLVRGLSLFPEGAFMDNLKALNGWIGHMTCTLSSAEINSVIIATFSCILATYFGSMCAYGFELFHFKGRKNLWYVIVGAMMFSQVSYSVGFLILITRLKLVNTLIPLIIPAIATPSVAYFMRMYLKIIPLKSIVEAARIDGCSELGIFHHMILPAIKPALALQIIFTFVTAWNNSFMHSLVLRAPEMKTITTYLQMIAGNRGSSGDPTTYVLLLLTTIPPMIVYAIFSKSIVSRIVLGSIKE